MNPYAMSVLLSSLSIGTTITISCHHWFLAWMSLEINTLAMVPLMSKMHHPRSTEAATKYFLIQASASALILFTIMLNAWLSGEWTMLNMQTQLSTVILTLAMIMKLGVAPLHFWLPDVLQGLDMMTCLILSTWQKLAPMALFLQINQNLNYNLLMSIGILSTLVGGWGGLNQTQFRKIMAFSSIAHLGWMMLILPFMSSLTLMNLVLYIMLTTTMFLMIMNMKAINISKMTYSWMKTPVLTTMMMMILMSMGGLPPTSGFMPKWLIIEELTKQNMMSAATLTMMSALLSLFFYLRLSYNISLTTTPSTFNSKLMWWFKPKSNMMLPLSVTLSTMILPLTPMIMNIYL
uniref:NADH-ubiquinone oxidoreductase chain 2 n=1 Tax=Rhyacotriton variegatus TaxID=291264 RepID=Q2TFA2_9SALA|nr:NADH dehydrogenase subunit 2 [Rhyacotriton variegatus]